MSLAAGQLLYFGSFHLSGCDFFLRRWICFLFSIKLITPYVEPRGQREVAIWLIGANALII
jgi:hypothetical protein